MSVLTSIRISRGLLGSALMLIAARGLAQPSQPPQDPRPPPITSAPETHSENQAPSTQAPVAPSPDIANMNPAYGPPMGPAFNAPQVAVPGGEETPSWYTDKGNSPYFDVFAAYGWNHPSYSFNASFFNLYVHDADSPVGFHVRFLAPGFLEFHPQTFHADGTSTPSRKRTFTLDVVDPLLRVYIYGPVFLSLGTDLGMSFHNGLVAQLDFLGGLGFSYAGWGLEAGWRATKLPHEDTTIGGKEFTYDQYAPQVYLAVETNLP